MATPFPARASGVLLPLAALPARHGIGDLGPSARRFLAWLAAAGQGWWQLLPVTPLGHGGSPYDSSSAFAGEPAYLSLEDLVADGLLPSTSARAPRGFATRHAQPDRARAWKRPRLEEAFRRWTARGGARRKAFERFCQDADHWLPGWEAFEGAEPGLTAFLQHRFQAQWDALRAEARAHGVRLLGDVPIFVGARSADVAARPELFRLDRRGRPKVVTGCPPDAYSADGQLWGHPHYAWRAHRAEGFAWWRARIGRQLALFDAVRIDHFIGFHHAWEVPASHTTARDGRWGKSAGRELLNALREERDDLPLLAEDLGAVTPEVLALRDAFGLPGMRVLHWGFGPGSEHAPFRVPENSVVYPATHDNDTTAGWWRGLDLATRRRVLAATGGTAAGVAWDLWRVASMTPANTAIVQLQDLLGLGRAARTNTPGTTRGNWRWRPVSSDLSRPLARRARELSEASGRLLPTP